VGDELELISDGEGIAVIGDPAVVDRFLSSAGVSSRDLALKQRLGSILSVGSEAAKVGSEISANSGRWVKLTEESAKALKVGKAMKGSSDGVSRAIATTRDGSITKILEFVKPGSIGAMLTSPAMLAGAAGVMAQLAMQQTMEEITEYLAVIDEKVDDILLAQKDAAIAEMVGVGWVIDDAMLKREHVGRVSEVTWSNLHGAAQTIATTQAFALRRLDALAEKMEKNSRVGDLAKIAGAAEASVEEWLAVLARCFQLQDGLGVLELDRVLDSSPDDLDRHLTAMKAARAARRELVSRSTDRLLTRMDNAALNANKQVLFHPLKAGTVVRSDNEIADDVTTFHERLGIDSGREAITARRWTEAVGDTRDLVVDAGSRGIETVKQLSARTLDGAIVVAERTTRSASRYLPGQGQRDAAAENARSDESTDD
jgi:hypothetical protein